MSLRIVTSIGLAVMAAAALAMACADEDGVPTEPTPHTLGDLLAALDERGLSYSMVGPETECWDNSPAGPTRYDGNRANLTVWVYDTTEHQQRAWRSEGSGPTTVSLEGLEDWLGCFDIQFWAARRGNIVVGLDPRDQDAIATGAIVVEALASLPEPADR